MAILNKSVLGKVSGALGDLVFRQTKGGNIIAVRPKSFMPGVDQESADRREKFRFSVKLASALNKIPEIYQIWDAHDSQKTPFQNLIRTNYPYIDPAGTPGRYKLTPEEGFGVNVGLIDSSSTEIRAELDPLVDNIGIDTEVEVGVKLISLMYLSDPVDEFAPAYRLLKVVSEEQPLDTESPAIFSVLLMNQDTEMINSYNNCEEYFALVTLDADGNVIHYSNTFRKS
jgi:hypothetical protein